MGLLWKQYFVQCKQQHGGMLATYSCFCLMEITDELLERDK
jgi:hypothetical protein